MCCWGWPWHVCAAVVPCPGGRVCAALVHALWSLSLVVLITSGLAALHSLSDAQDLVGYVKGGSMLVFEQHLSQVASRCAAGSSSSQHEACSGVSFPGKEHVDWHGSTVHLGSASVC